MRIRLFRPTDSAALKTIHTALYPGQSFTMGRHTWVIEDGEEVMGYTAVFPVPGLDGLFSLIGGVVPRQQRRGVGSQLLAHTLREAPGLGIRRLSHAVTDLNSPTVPFLRQHGFFIEHEEWLMMLPDLTRLGTATSTSLSADVPPTACRIQTYHTFNDAARQFRALYDQSFGDNPWYQPYSTTEMEDTLNEPTDILFLIKDDEPIGFAWLRKEAIEPIGIVKEEQGKGYGRFLLLSTLHKLKQRGAGQGQIGTWRENETAVRLYKSLGFQHQKTITYLARNITSD